MEAIDKLSKQLPNAIVNEIQFLGETTIEVTKTDLKKVLSFLKKVPENGFEVLIDLTGVDYLFPEKRTKIVYWLHHPHTLERIRVILFAARDEAIPSVIDLWEGAAWYERELYDLFGVRFDGHPNLSRILMPDDWRGHPLRRDYSLTEESVDFKHGVKPKVPSHIIPYVKSNEK